MTVRTGRNGLNENTVKLALLMFSAAAGTAAGAAAAPSELARGAADYVYALRENIPLWQTVWTSLKGMLILTAVCFALGFSAVSQPAEALLPFFFGTGFGAVMSGLLSSGKVFSFAAMLPGGVLGALALALAARESMRMSGAVFRRAFLPDEYTPADIVLYIKKFLIIIMIGFAAAAADGICAALWTV